MLERLLESRESVPDDGFVLNVMQQVRRQRRLRRTVLAACGVIGAAFGLAGAAMLSDPIAQLFSGLPVTGTMQAVLVAVAAIALYGWFMNEDLSLYA